jgi:hypothetical protein
MTYNLDYSIEIGTNCSEKNATKKATYEGIGRYDQIIGLIIIYSILI